MADIIEFPATRLDGGAAPVQVGPVGSDDPMRQIDALDALRARLRLQAVEMFEIAALAATIEAAITFGDDAALAALQDQVQAMRANDGGWAPDETRPGPWGVAPRASESTHARKP